MKFAYLLHYINKNYDEITENLDTILDAGDDCYIIVNDNNLRDDLMLAYVDEPRMHIIHKQEAALPGDLSLARGTILSIMEALEAEQSNPNPYDAFINLTDGMIPVRSKKEFEDYLNKHPDMDIYHIETTSDENKALSKRFEDYAFFTNAMDFQTSKLIQGMNKLTSSVVSSFKHKKLEDTLVLTYPWFVLRHDSAQALYDHFSYCSENFKMCMYPEELAIGTILHKYSNTNHYDDCIWAVNEDGKYRFESPIQNVSREAVSKSNIFFAGKMHSDDNFDLYQDYFDIYKENTNE